MLVAPLPENESRRLEYLRKLNILDTPADPDYDAVAWLASEICQTPIAAISLVDGGRQWFKSKVGIEATESSRDIAFCSHAILQRDLFVVENLLEDERFRDNPFVTAPPHVRFYAGAPLVTAEGFALGTLCVIDQRPRKLTETQSRALGALARQVETTLRLQWTIAQLSDSEECAKRLSLHDTLTRLPNRLLFADRVNRCLERAKRDPKNLFAVMFLDLDRFKIVNDSLGHVAGDALLKTMADRLRRCLRSSDSLGIKRQSLSRMGGDEFTVLLDGIKHPLDPIIVAERILKSLSAPIEYEGHELRATASIGIVTCGGEQTYTSVEGLLRDADTAMYRAKSQGKNCYCVFDNEMHQAATARQRLETDLSVALERGQFLLHFQPMISIESGGVFGFEALVRWNRDGRLVDAATFVPAAEDSGLILKLGRWVISEAIRELSAWRKKDPTMPRITMSVNLSGKQLADPQLLGCIYDELNRHAVNPSDLILEISESALIANGEANRQVLDMIKLLGVGIAIDDFGAGYSSLSCLHRFPIHLLKIDPCLIQDLAERRDVEAVMDAVIKLAHNLGIEVVAEGIETEEQITRVRSLGCDYVQGFLFSRPLNPEAACEFTARKTLPTAA